MVLFLGWKTLQDVYRWMGNLFTFFWYVQQSSISKLVGQVCMYVYTCVCVCVCVCVCTSAN
jgi:hypothetical protein